MLSIRYLSVAPAYCQQQPSTAHMLIGSRLQWRPELGTEERSAAPGQVILCVNAAAIPVGSAGRCKSGRNICVRRLCSARMLGYTWPVGRPLFHSLTCLRSHRGQASRAAACAGGSLARARGGQRRARPLRAWDSCLVPPQGALQAVPSSSVLVQTARHLLASSGNASHLIHSLQPWKILALFRFRLSNLASMVHAAEGVYTIRYKRSGNCALVSAALTPPCRSIKHSGQCQAVVTLKIWFACKTDTWEELCWDHCAGADRACAGG